jgi:DNA-binding MarR family transcriptional regulator
MGVMGDEPSCSAFLVRQAWLSMRSVVGDALSAHGISVAQYAALMLLAEQPGMSAAHLARCMASARQSTNELLTGLERAGLVDRRPHETDRRAHQVWLTDAGIERLAAAAPVVRGVEKRLSEGFEPEELAVVQAWLTRMVAAAPDATDGHS